MKDNTKHLKVTLRRLYKRLHDLEDERLTVTDAIESLKKLLSMADAEAAAEFVTTKPPRRSRASGLADAAQEVLQELGKPVQIRSLVNHLQNRGKFAGHDADRLKASLVSTLQRRDDIFSNPQRGYYGLKEWGAMPDRVDDGIWNPIKLQR